MGSLAFGYPSEYLLLCLLGGVVYAWVMYSKKAPWSPLVNRILFVLRALVSGMLLVLLLEPVLRQIQNTTEPPQVVIAVDNLLSNGEIYDSIQQRELNNTINRMATEIGNMGYETVVVSEGEVYEGQAELSFDLERTNLDAMLKDIGNDFEGRNLSEVLLFSDGIVNTGMLPIYRNYPFRLTAVAVGDSTPRYDISIEELTYNKIAYQGNQFLIRARLRQFGFDKAKIPLFVYHMGEAIARQTVDFSDGPVQEVDFFVTAETNGMQRYTVALPIQENEFIEENNRTDAYIEIIEGQQKIVILAASPHPDVSAISEVLEKNPNYEVVQMILSIPEDRARLEAYQTPTDLYILHQLPAAASSIDWSTRLKDQSVLLLYGPQTDLGRLPALFPSLSIEAFPGEFDQVTAVVNQGYAPFSYSDELQAMFNEFPPLVTPFGEFVIRAETDILLTQRVGSINTNKPLLLTREGEEAKYGLMLGSGIWQWKLTDYARNKDNRLFEEFMNNLIQYITTRADKRKFRFYPIKQEYTSGEEVVFQAELYNELYEKVYGYKIDLKLIKDGETSNYTYVPSEENSRYVISGLDEGVYTYTATAAGDDGVESVTGEFAIQDLALETIHLTADFDMLRNLAGKSGGEFFTYENVDQLIGSFEQKEAQGRIHSQEKYLSAINLLWIFLLLVLLVTVEWGIRKYHGSY